MSYDKKMGERIKELMTVFQGQTFYSTEQVHTYIREMMIEIADHARRLLTDGEEVEVKKEAK